VTHDVSHDDDEKLVALCREGDRIAFDRLVLKYQHLVVGMCTRLLGSTQDGEDAAQECFVKVYRNISRFAGESSFSTWLYRIAVNTCRNYHKSWWSRLRKQSVKLDAPRRSDGEDDDNGPSIDLRDTRFVPAKDLERKRLGATIAQALEELPAGQREMVVLRDVQGLTYDEIEKITGQAEGTVKSRLFRARAVLQEKLKGVAL
jgi:RNA polymerase sigma-70 factor (ECF subfamily)